MDPLHEVTIGTGVAIKSIIRGHINSKEPHLLVVDSHGSIYRINLIESFTALKNRAGGDIGFHLEVKTEKALKLFDFHSGKITSMDTSPIDHFAVTGGEDGTVRCWDYITKKEVFKMSWGMKYDVIENDDGGGNGKKGKLSKRKSTVKNKEEAIAATSSSTKQSVSSVTTLKWAPTTVAPDGRSVFVGFSDGVVRVLWRGTVNPAGV